MGSTKSVEMSCSIQIFCQTNFDSEKAIGGERGLNITKLDVTTDLL